VPPRKTIAGAEVRASVLGLVMGVLLGAALRGQLSVMVRRVE
jgi:hypothetical protein